jgi:hypothetical protein
MQLAVHVPEVLQYSKGFVCPEKHFDMTWLDLADKPENTLPL